MSELSLVRRFSELGIHDRTAVGGKGASLGELTRSGIRVPPGCVVTTDAFERFLSALDPKMEIRRLVEQLSANDHEAVVSRTAEVRARIENAAMAGDLRAGIAEHYNELQVGAGDLGPSAPVAIRSSATSEDSAEASFAGLQDTYLWVRGLDSVLDHVRKCWASLYSVESVTYRRRLKVPEEHLAMGVVIQRMIDSRCAGVMFTRSPTTGDRSVVVIEASLGLGSAIVSGEVTPDKYVIAKVTGEISNRILSQKVRQHRPNPAGAGVVEEEVPAGQQNVACLSDDEICALVDVARRIERHYGCPQDIEWAIARNTSPNESIFVLQSRPETAWADREAAPIAGPKANAFEHVLSLLSRGAVKK